MDSIKPAVVNIHVNSVEVADEIGESKHLLYVVVRRSLWLHESAGGYFYRLSYSKRKMSAEHLLRIAQSRSQARTTRFDELAVTSSILSSLHPDFALRFVTNMDVESLHNRRLITLVNDHWIPTVSGVLMCCSTPEEHLYNSFIQAVCYNGLTKDAN